MGRLYQHMQIICKYTWPSGSVYLWEAMSSSHLHPTTVLGLWLWQVYWAEHHWDLVRSTFLEHVWPGAGGVCVCVCVCVNKHTHVFSGVAEDARGLVWRWMHEAGGTH